MVKRNLLEDIPSHVPSESLTECSIKLDRDIPKTRIRHPSIAKMGSPQKKHVCEKSIRKIKLRKFTFLNVSVYSVDKRLLFEMIYD